MEPVVSIITTLYNYANYIEDNIRGALSQSYKNWEFIIVDDCSSDHPFPIIDKYIKDNNIRYYRLEKNRGYSYAKNYGIMHSSGKYIVMIDADDILTENSLELRVRSLEENPESMWAHGRALVFSGNLDKTEPEQMLYKRWKSIQKGKLSRGMAWKSIHAQTVMAKRELYNQVGLYDEKMRFSSDREMWLRILNQNIEPTFVDDFVCYYRMHNKQMHKSDYKKRKMKNNETYMKKISEIRKNGIDLSNTKFHYE